jgi:Cupredoxin-like domain
MTRNGSKQMSAALLCATLLVGLPLFTACGGDKTEAPEIQTVQVGVTDQQLQMPESLPTGPTKFEVTNKGTHEHSFGITGPAGDQKLEQTLKPGESASLELYLDTGTYRVFCPVDESNGHAVQMALNVLPQTEGGKS